MSAKEEREREEKRRFAHRGISRETEEIEFLKSSPEEARREIIEKIKKLEVHNGERETSKA